MARVLCFGEVLLRLASIAPARLEDAGALDVHVGGAEANVAIALAGLGHDSAIATRLPDNALGERARTRLRGAGVDLSACTGGAGRMGLYFHSPGAGLRKPSVVYDRAGSAFALSEPGDFDWPAMLRGFDHFHVSGVTLALSPALAEAAVAGAKAARAAGLGVSFDGNYRALLWDAAPHDAVGTIDGLLQHATMLFANHRDAALLLGREFPGDGPERRREAALALLERYAALEWVASTARQVEDERTHRIAARLDRRDAEFDSGEWCLTNVVDRIGGGDAFAAGVLHGWSDSGGDAQAAVDAGIRLSAFKHSIAGDNCRPTRADLEAITREAGDVAR